MINPRIINSVVKLTQGTIVVEAIGLMVPISVRNTIKPTITTLNIEDMIPVRLPIRITPIIGIAITYQTPGPYIPDTIKIAMAAM